MRGEWIDKGWKGDWQFETDGRGNCWHEYECSKCGFRNIGNKSNFCPNCGNPKTEEALRILAERNGIDIKGSDNDM